MVNNLKNKKLFKIGEVSKMFGISMGTLRHYEQMGLLTPEYIDEETGYRYYGARQLEVMNTIRYMRALDIPLQQIADFLNNRNIEIMEEKLLKQKEIIKRKQYELELISHKLDHRIEQLKDAVNSELNKIRIKKMPEVRIVILKTSLKPETYLDLEYDIRKLVENQRDTLVFLGKVGIGISKENLVDNKFLNYNLVYMILDDEDVYEGKIDILPEQKYVTIRFCGSHNDAPQYYSELLDYIREKKMIITGFSREITLIDYGLTNDTGKFVTEIAIPVK